jgi:hypothetical protein
VKRSTTFFTSGKFTHTSAANRNLLQKRKNFTTICVLTIELPRSGAPHGSAFGPVLSTYTGVFEMPAQILITSYWLHVELGKNIKKIKLHLFFELQLF